MTSISSITAVAPSTVASPAFGNQQGQATTSAAAANAPIVVTPAKAANTNSVATASRQIEDPLAGVLITQSVDAAGQVINQFPSTAVVAYLREGLASDGGPLPHNGAPAQDTFA